MNFFWGYLLTAGYGLVLSVTTQDLPYVDAVRTYAWRIAGTDFCEANAEEISLSASIPPLALSILKVSGASQFEVERYQLVYYVEYATHLELRLEERAKDGGAFCNQIDDQLSIARILAQEEFVATLLGLE